MAVSETDLATSYPEFIPAGADLRLVKIAEAELQVDADVWGPKADIAVMLTAAHLLAISPYGQQARLTNKNGMTTYMQELKRMQRQVGHGFRLI